jgi:hypothetical protein
LNWYYLSVSPNITWAIVEENPDKPWHWYNLSMNRNITWDIVRANPDKPWNWCGFSRNPSITWEIVEENPDKPWDWWGLSKNPNILLSDLELCTIIRKHRSIKIIKRVWKCAVSDPKYIVCRKRLLREFDDGVGN